MMDTDTCVRSISLTRACTDQNDVEQIILRRVVSSLQIGIVQKTMDLSLLLLSCDDNDDLLGKSNGSRL